MYVQMHTCSLRSQLTSSDSVNVYVALGSKSTRLLRLSSDDIEKGTLADPVECTFPAPKAKKTKKKATIDDEEDEGEDEDEDGKPSTTKKAKPKPRKKTKKPLDEEKDIVPASESDDDFAVDETDHELDGIESSSDKEGEWEIAVATSSRKGPKSSKTR